MEKYCQNIGCANIANVFLLHPEVKRVILLCNRCWKHKIIYFGWHTEYTEISKEEAEAFLIINE